MHVSRVWLIYLIYQKAIESIGVISAQDHLINQSWFVDNTRRFEKGASFSLIIVLNMSFNKINEQQEPV